jgi:hypothetical protein
MDAYERSYLPTHLRALSQLHGRSKMVLCCRDELNFDSYQSGVISAIRKRGNVSVDFLNT